MTVTIIGVAGPSGSGKTTIAKELNDYFGSERCITISSDNYYKDLSHLTIEQRKEVNFDHPDSIDFELLAKHLGALKNKQPVEIPTYDFNTHSRTDKTVKIDPRPIIIVEGILAQHPEFLAKLYDTKIFVDTHSDICFIRRLERDMKERGRTVHEVIAQYKRDVKPMYEKYVAPCKKRADIIIENSDDNFETSEGLRFDIKPLVTCLEAKQSNTQFKFKLFARSKDGAPHSNMEVESEPLTVK